MPYFQCDSTTQFTCMDGSCINITNRCDNVRHCPDDSDENNCHILMLDKAKYRKSSKPPPLKGQTDLKISIRFYVVSIDKVQELESDYRIGFWLLVSWQDRRLSYQNLRQDERKNILEHEEAKSIWTPLLLFPDSYGKNAIGYHSNAYIFISKDEQNHGTITPLSETDEGIFYEGKDHSINLFQRFGFQHHCSFNLRHYPFDQQMCPLTV